jgi:hemerythrin-like domain-containing protein
MTYSKPIQMLVDDHQVILSVLDAIDNVIQQDASQTEFPGQFYEQALDFLSTFADKCHHAKEENLLFPLLEARGIPRDRGPIGCMLSEHEEGREHIAAARKALAAAVRGDAQAAETVREEMSAYADLLQQHIQKENEVLFVMGDQRMTPQDKEDLWKKFHCAEHEAVPPGTHEKYLALAQQLHACAAS